MALETRPCSQAMLTPPEEAGYRLVETNINFIGKPLTNGTLVPKGLITSFPVGIRYYDSEKAIINDFEFFKNGFEYKKLEKDTDLTRAIDAYAKASLINGYPLQEEKELSLQVQQLALSWARQKNIPGAPVIINSIYRNSDPEANSGASPIHFAHIDYSKEDITNPSSHVNQCFYKPEIMNAFNVMSNEDYNNVRHEAQINVWIPLHEEDCEEESEDIANDNTLVVMDINGQGLPENMLTYSLGGKSTGHGVHFDPKQTWVAKKDLTRKKRMVIFFNTTLTPHSAVQIEGDPWWPPRKDPRRSIEFRIDFCSRNLTRAT